MAEVTTSVTKVELERVVAQHAGFAIFDSNDVLLTSADRTNQENYRIEESLKGGIGLIAESGWDFSFLRPIALITLASGASTVDLPSDFSWLIGDVIPYEAAATRCRFPIRPAGDVYALESESPTMTGPPQVGCVDAVRGTGPNQSNRFQLKVFPVADQAYPLRIQYSLIQNAMTDSFPYAYGCGQHPQLLKAAVIAAYEMRYDKPNTDCWMMFQQLLQAAVTADKRRKASNAGQNIDTSDYEEHLYGDRSQYRSWGTISINGNVPS